MKLMDSSSWQEPNHSDRFGFREDLQRRSEDEGAISWAIASGTAR
jgi:hypothetical protein